MGLLEEVAELSESFDLPIHCHVLETRTQAVTGQEKYGCTLVQFLKDTGCLTHRLTMNHAIWLTDQDIEMMGDAKCSITHNPLANLKLGSGVAPVRELLRAGVNVRSGLRRRRLGGHGRHVRGLQGRRDAAQDRHSRLPRVDFGP